MNTRTEVTAKCSACTWFAVKDAADAEAVAHATEHPGHSVAVTTRVVYRVDVPYTKRTS